MAADGVAPESLRSVIARLEVTGLATPGYYLKQFAEAGPIRVDFDDHSEQLLTHYVRLVEETRRSADQLRELVGPAYLEGLLENLPLWVAACRQGRLSWGSSTAATTGEGRDRPSAAGHQRGSPSSPSIGLKIGLSLVDESYRSTPDSGHGRPLSRRQR